MCSPCVHHRAPKPACHLPDAGATARLPGALFFYLGLSSTHSYTASQFEGLEKLNLRLQGLRRAWVVNTHLSINLSLWGDFLSSVQKGDPVFLRLGMCEKLRQNFCSLDFPRKQGQHVPLLLICLSIPASSRQEAGCACRPISSLVCQMPHRAAGVSGS